MKAVSVSVFPHPQGEGAQPVPALSGSWPVDAPGGRFHAEWDDTAPVTREGSLLFFFQFLETGGRWEHFLKDCPLAYRGNRGSGANNVLGTVLLSVLSGTVSEDVVRLAMQRIPEAAGLDWLCSQILDTIAPALGLPWILDIDVTVKPLYGHQEGAETGYNPQKPGRPSHVYHRYFVANLRISLGVEVRPGNEHAGARGLSGLWQTLGKLPRHQWPTFLRGDCGDGWQALESSLRLSGWSRPRRVILVREAPSCAPIAEADLVAGPILWLLSPHLRGSVPGPGRNGGEKTGKAGFRSLTPVVPEGTPGPRHAAARSPCSSPPLILPSGPPATSPNNTGTGPTPKTVLTNSKTSGAGAAIPPANWPPAGSWPT